MLGVYPPDPYTYGEFHLAIEYLYEFLRGSRLVQDHQVVNCEAYVSDFFEAIDKGAALLNNTPTDDDAEGVFQILDSFMFLTPITWECYKTGTFALYVISTDIRANILEPWSIGINVMVEMFYILSNIAAEMANNYYQDWYSFSYFLGDMVYRFFVVHHPEYS